MSERKPLQFKLQLVNLHRNETSIPYGSAFVAEFFPRIKTVKREWEFQDIEEQQEETEQQEGEEQQEEEEQKEEEEQQ